MIDAATLELMKLNLRADCERIMAGYVVPPEPRDLLVEAGRRMADLRRAEGLTQHALGEITGYDQSLLSRFERGVRTPTTAQRRDIAQALGAEVTDIWR